MDNDLLAVSLNEGCHGCRICVSVTQKAIISPSRLELAVCALSRLLRDRST